MTDSAVAGHEYFRHLVAYTESRPLNLMSECGLRDEAARSTGMRFLK